MLRKAIAGSHLISLFTGALLAQDPQLHWVSQFGGLGLGNEVLHAVDASGDVYVCGTTGQDLLLQKMGPDGGALWTRTFGTPATDTPEAVLVHPAGVVLVGTTQGTLVPGAPGGSDGFLRMYDVDGNELWTRQFGTTASETIADATIHDGNIYVGGNTLGTMFPFTTSTGSNAFLTSFDVQGNQTWVRQMSNNLGWTLVGIRGLGDCLYTAGRSGSDVTIGYLKLANFGNSTIIINTTSQETVNGMAVGAEGIYLCGAVVGSYAGNSPVGGRDAFVAKFPFGVPLNGAPTLVTTPAWVTQFGTTGDDSATAVVVNASGLYVTGTVPTPAASTDGFVRKLSPAGTTQWETMLATSSADTPRAIAFGGDGVVVCGNTLGVFPGQAAEEPNNAFVASLDEQGGQSWLRQFGFLAVGNVPEVGSAVADDGSLFVVGTTSGILDGQPQFGGLDGYVRKYTAQGALLWSRTFGTSGSDSVSGVAVSGANILVVGSSAVAFPGTGIVGGSDVFVRCYNPEGEVTWTRMMGGAGQEQTGKIAVDASSLWIAGSTTSSVGGQTLVGQQDAFLLKCTLGGDVVWWRLSGHSGFDSASGLATHGGGAYLTLNVLGTATCAITRYDVDGNIVWNTEQPGVLQGAFADDSGVVCGGSSMLRRFSHTGVLDWSVQGFGLEGGLIVDVGGSGDRYYYVGRSIRNNGMVASCDRQGVLAWRHEFDASTGSVGSSEVRGISVSGGRLAVVGQTQGVIAGQLAQGGQDAFLAVFRTAAVDQTLPTAVAGDDRSIHAGVVVHLDGSQSFDDTSTVLTYSWVMSSRPILSSAQIVDSSTAFPSFLADQPGSYEVQLVVQDEAGNRSLVDSIEISSWNIAPTADAGPDRIVVVGHSVQLDGSGSADPDMDPITYQWVMLSAPPQSVAAIGNGTASVAGFTPDRAGSYMIGLTVSDGFAQSSIATCHVVAVTPAVFATMVLGQATEQVGAMTVTSFDAPGHQRSIGNLLAKIARCVEDGDFPQARQHLAQVIVRVDGWTLRGAFDPKGLGQPNDADFIVAPVEQMMVYGMMMQVLSVIGT